MTYALGNVKPWVANCANQVGPQFGITTVFGFGLRPDASSDHPAGLALDFMVGADRSKGDSLAAYILANHATWNVKYVIWYQRIWDYDRNDTSWRQMADRGTVTANHKDHVHISFHNSAGSGVVQVGLPNPLNLLPDVPDLGAITDSVKHLWDSISSIAKVFSFLSDSHNWLRLAMAGGGAILLMMTFDMFSHIKAPLKEAATVND